MINIESEYERIFGKPSRSSLFDENDKKYLALREYIVNEPRNRTYYNMYISRSVLFNITDTVCAKNRKHLITEETYPIISRIISSLRNSEQCIGSIIKNLSDCKLYNNTDNANHL